MDDELLYAAKYLDFPSVFHLLIPSHDDRRFLAHVEDGIVRLPKVFYPGNALTGPVPCMWSDDTDIVVSLASKALKRPIFLRRMLWDNPKPRGRQECVVVADIIQPDDPDETIPEGLRLEWMTHTEARAGAWRAPDSKCDIDMIVEDYFIDAQSSEVAEKRAAWRTRAWWKEINEWIKVSLSEFSREPPGDVTVHRNSFQSTVMSCNVPSIGTVYVKQSLPFCEEARVTSAVASLLPTVVAKVLGRSENAFLQLAASDVPAPVPRLVLTKLADMQLNSICLLDDLQGAGVKRRGMAWLKSSMDGMLHDSMFETYDENKDLIELRSRIPELEGLCDRMLEISIPDTLVHGDLDVSNIMCGTRSNPSVTFIDWANCKISHPFLDYQQLRTVGWVCEGYEQAKDVYMNRWLEFATQSQIDQALKCIPPLLYCIRLYEWIELYQQLEEIEQKQVRQIFPEAFESIVYALNEVQVKNTPTE